MARYRVDLSTCLFSQIDKLLHDYYGVVTSNIERIETTFSLTYTVDQ
jgi:hypothetical protein